MIKYEDELGPSIEWFLNRGDSWDDIIESASRTGGQDLWFFKKIKGVEK